MEKQEALNFLDGLWKLGFEKIDELYCKILHENLLTQSRNQSTYRFG